MDAFAILGFIFGMVGMSLAIAANAAVARNRAELDKLAETVNRMTREAPTAR